MASWTDLTQEQLSTYKSVRQTLIDSTGHASPLELQVVAGLVAKYPASVMGDTALQCGLNKWFKVDHLKHLARLYAQYGKERTEWAIERMNGLNNHSLDTVEGILKGDIAPYRKPAISKDIARPVQKLSKYPTADHVYSPGTAHEWLNKRGDLPENVWTYFDRAGTDSDHGYQLFRLKAEYR